jgi:hypothetical protein
VLGKAQVVRSLLSLPRNIDVMFVGFISFDLIADGLRLC